MVVIQPTKNKVRLVLDFRELNGHMVCHTGDGVTDVCGETLKEGSLYYCEFESCLSANSCGREVVEVSAGEIQGKNLLFDEVGVRVELGAKNHDKDP